ncbi:hypothetical protein HELRODRAFT_176798 [Helobdella robusta]|uniref:Uncharacterized protein n=1 Tax=Helobdella robusta TaxID=6412 RepID=T1FAX2_HELRO|nr:hypothetical protein HELRODRAFT_176798 [Helobdella robusta]ESN99628.1 hypothetical protein HELRODRAFT_176798 [Helobdella robusta]
MLINLSRGIAEESIYGWSLELEESDHSVYMTGSDFLFDAINKVENDEKLLRIGNDDVADLQTSSCSFVVCCNSNNFKGPPSNVSSLTCHQPIGMEDIEEVKDFVPATPRSAFLPSSFFKFTKRNDSVYAKVYHQPPSNGSVDKDALGLSLLSPLNARYNNLRFMKMGDDGYAEPVVQKLRRVQATIVCKDKKQQVKANEYYDPYGVKKMEQTNDNIYDVIATNNNINTMNNHNNNKNTAAEYSAVPLYTNKNEQQQQTLQLLPSLQQRQPQQQQQLSQLQKLQQRTQQHQQQQQRPQQLAQQQQQSRKHDQSDTDQFLDNIFSGIGDDDSGRQHNVTPKDIAKKIKGGDDDKNLPSSLSLTSTGCLTS